MSSYSFVTVVFAGNNVIRVANNAMNDQRDARHALDSRQGRVYHATSACIHLSAFSDPLSKTDFDLHATAPGRSGDNMFQASSGTSTCASDDHRKLHERESRAWTKPGLRLFGGRKQRDESSGADTREESSKHDEHTRAATTSNADCVDEMEKQEEAGDQVTSTADESAGLEEDAKLDEKSADSSGRADGGDEGEGTDPARQQGKEEQETRYFMETSPAPAHGSNRSSNRWLRWWHKLASDDVPVRCCCCCYLCV